MTPKTEYRVRAVTRYIVTRNCEHGTEELGEHANLALANEAGEAMAKAQQAADPDRSVTFHGIHQKHGAVMRCKVSLFDRMVNIAAATDGEGKYLGRMIEKPDSRGGTYKTPDPQDPANWRPDGEKLRFAAVCAGFDANGVANVEENRIFGHWSPSVNFEAVVRNQSVLEKLELGGEYYVDFIPAPKAAG